MSLIHSLTRKSLLATCFFLATPIWLSAQTEEQAEGSLLADETAASDMVDRIVFRDETTDQVLDLLERLTGRSIIRPQALPAATFTFNSQKPMTRKEAILALESMLSINGIGVTPLGELFIKVVPLGRMRSEAPEFLTESSLNLPPSGRVVSRMLTLEFLGLDEIQTQLNLMITSGSGSIIPFPKANAMLITDTVSNLQAIEELVAAVDRPFAPPIETHFFPIRYARAVDIVGQIESLAGTGGVPELSARTNITADERSNQIILVADTRQVEHFQKLIEKLDVQADVVTKNEVIFLKHADSVAVSSILSQLATGRSGGGAGTGARPGGAGSAARPGGNQQATRSGQQSRQQSSQRQRSRGGQQGSPPMPPGVRAQQATDGENGGLSLEAAESALGDVAASVTGSDFSESLTILPDERTNAIIVSGTRQDIDLITDLIEKIDIILAQVRIEVFIAEVTLSDTDGRGIEAFELGLTEGTSRADFKLQGPGYTISRDGLDWDLAFNAAKTKSEIQVLSVPTVVTTHNREATIVVGESRPVITGTLSDGSFGGGSIRSQVQMMDIAIELRVTPLIGTDGTIQLEIFQKVDDVGELVEIDANLQPTIIRREAESFVSVADGETVVLGGLQSSRQSNNDARLGILGQIPILGNLFTSNRKENTRRELLVFIRPTVLPTTQMAHRDAQEQIDKQSRAPYIRHQLEPETHRHPDAAEHSEEARALREQSLRRQAEQPPASQPEPEPEPEPEPLPPEPVPEPEPQVESPASEPEASEEEARQPVRRRTGAGRRL